MDLYVNTLNPDSSQPDLFMVHGWAMHSGLWMGFAQRLTQKWRVTLVDLPGHGDSGACPVPGLDLEDWAAALLDVAPAQATWLGWSLGGLLAQQAAIDAAQRVQGLILISSTPCFTRRDDWPQAVDAQVFKQFADNLAKRPQTTLMRFLSLQVQGDAQSKATLRQLREGLLEKPFPSSEALTVGLSLLLESDIRAGWQSINVPIMAIFGALDVLVPVETAQSVQTLGSKPVCRIIENSGHSPFVFHVEQVIDAMEAGLAEIKVTTQRVVRQPSNCSDCP